MPLEYKASTTRQRRRTRIASMKLCTVYMYMLKRNTIRLSLHSL